MIKFPYSILNTDSNRKVTDASYFSLVNFIDNESEISYKEQSEPKELTFL